MKNMRDMENLYEWRKKNIKHLNVDLNVETDKDVIEWIEKKDNKRQYIIELIRKDIKKKGAN